MKNRMNKQSSDTQDQDTRALYFTDQRSVDEVARLYTSAQASNGPLKRGCPWWESLLAESTHHKKRDS